jgi:hypothetical protein
MISKVKQKALAETHRQIFESAKIVLTDERLIAVITKHNKRTELHGKQKSRTSESARVGTELQTRRGMSESGAGSDAQRVVKERARLGWAAAIRRKAESAWLLIRGL